MEGLGRTSVNSAVLELHSRCRKLSNCAHLAKANFAIEPIDEVTFRARVAKEQRILRFAPHSLHFELPADRILYDTRTRRAYTEILSELIQRITMLRPAPIAARAATLLPQPTA